MNFKNVLLLSAHPDDAEIGAGGTVAFLSQRGAEIDHLIFSKCRKSLPEGYTVEGLLDECRAADKILGIRETTILDYPVRRFDDHRQEILDILWKKRQENYDLVICHWPEDTHQDHQTLAKEVVRAWKRAVPTILFYEIPANCIGFAPNYFFVLSDKEVEIKLNALNEYQSQIVRTPEYFSLDKFRAVLTHTGMAVGEKYAEGFVMHTSTIR